MLFGFGQLSTNREEQLEKAKSFEISKHLLWNAYKRVKQNGGAAGVDRQTIEDFERKLKSNLYKIWNRMSSGSYFPSAVRRVEIPKKSGGTRPLGIPTVADRIGQMAAKLVLEPMLEPHFHSDSYGYRPGKSAHDALGRTRERCWKYDWVIDLDIKGFFDNIDHDLMMKAVRAHKPPKWVELYIERWLKAPVQEAECTSQPRDRGTPQGGVISPLLANLYLHYAFDLWIKRTQPAVLFERYADDIVIHCGSLKQAIELKAEIEKRLAECQLAAHPEKTKIVYCKDDNRKGTYENETFDFLGFTFRPRSVRGNYGRLFTGFTPAMSKKAEQAIRDEIKSWRVHKLTGMEIGALSNKFNPKIRGWIQYYEKFRPSLLWRLCKQFQQILFKWAKNKYKRLKGSLGRADNFIDAIAKQQPWLFIHWQRNWY